MTNAMQKDINGMLKDINRVKTLKMANLALMDIQEKGVFSKGMSKESRQSQLASLQNTEGSRLNS